MDNLTMSKIFFTLIAFAWLFYRSYLYGYNKAKRQCVEEKILRRMKND